MKKSIIVLLAVCAAVCMCACGSSSKKLVMATNAAFPPYESVEGDKIVGIDPEIAQLIADDLGMELVIEDMAFDSIIADFNALWTGCCPVSGCVLRA